MRKLLVFLCLLLCMGSARGQTPLAQPTAEAMAGLASPAQGYASKKLMAHVHSTDDDGHKTVLEVATSAKNIGYGGIYFTVHDRYAALKRNYAAFCKDTADASAKTGIPVAPGVEWTINWNDGLIDRGAHVYIPKAFPREYGVLIDGLSHYATSPEAAYGSHSDWTGKRNSDSLLLSLVNLANANNEPLVVCHPDIWSPSLTIYQYNALPIKTLKALGLKCVGLGANNHEAPYGGPENLLAIAAAYEAAGIRTSFMADNDDHQVPLDWPPYFPRRNWRNTFFMGPETRPGYHTGSVITYGKDVLVKGCSPIPNVLTKTTELNLQIAGSTPFAYCRWSVYTDLARHTRLGGGPIPSDGIIRWAIPPVYRQPGSTRRYFIIMDGFDWESLTFEPFLITSGMDVAA